MKKIGYIVLFIFLFIQACGQESNQRQAVNQDTLTEYNHETTKKCSVIINPDGQTLETRILTPEGFERTITDENSFAEYLKQLPLKPHGSEVTFYNGSTKPNYDVYDAVVDLNIGKKDLHQCADAVMRLRAEYLWKQKQYDKIHFNFTNGFRVDLTLNPQTKEKIFLLAQSYMPAQEIQILKNPDNNNKISPWYSVDFGEILETPEWTFYKTDVKRFEE